MGKEESRRRVGDSRGLAVAVGWRVIGLGEVYDGRDERAEYTVYKTSRAQNSREQLQQTALVHPKTVRAVCGMRYAA